MRIIMAYTNRKVTYTRIEKNAISFLSIRKHAASPRVTLERIFVNPKHIVGLEEIHKSDTCKLVLTNGFYVIKGLHYSIKRKLEKAGVKLSPVQTIMSV